MAKPTQVKCKQCGQSVDKDKAIQVSDRAYCCSQECAEMFEEKKLSKKKNYKSVEGSARESCTDYIQSLYLEQGYTKKSINWSIIGSQLANLLKDNPTWKYSTIIYCLWYMKEIKEMNLFDGSQGSILNLIPFYVEEAKKYYFETQEITKTIDEFEFNDEVRIIKVNNKVKKCYNIDERF